MSINHVHSWLFRIGWAILLLVGSPACGAVPPTATSVPGAPVQTPTVGVLVTAWTAVAHGTLVLSDGCLKLKSSDYARVEYSLAWPPDFQAKIAGDAVVVTSGLVTGNRQQVTLALGEAVTLGGGTVDELDETLRETVPSSCEGPYWVVGGVQRSTP